MECQQNCLPSPTRHENAHRNENELDLLRQREAQSYIEIERLRTRVAQSDKEKKDFELKCENLNNEVKTLQNLVRRIQEENDIIFQRLIDKNNLLNSRVKSFESAIKSAMENDNHFQNMSVFFSEIENLSK